MAKVRTLSSKVYDQKFEDHINYHYSPEHIKESVEKLDTSTEIDLKSLEYGQYQPILSNLSAWPGQSGQFWKAMVSRARLSLTNQGNNDALSNDEPNVKPLTRCALLDAAVRKCFNSNPPIPMKIHVEEKDKASADADKHDIKLIWEYGKDGIPTLLKLTMVCPYLGRPPS